VLITSRIVLQEPVISRRRGRGAGHKDGSLSTAGRGGGGIKNHSIQQLNPNPFNPRWYAPGGARPLVRAAISVAAADRSPCRSAGGAHRSIPDELYRTGNLETLVISRPIPEKDLERRAWPR